MKLAIMQPYFFPYIGYFQLMYSVDKFIIFDIVQYERHSWINRNRILSPNLGKEWTYITVPLDRIKQGTLIKDVKINYNLKWERNILGKLTYYKKIRAPYYEQIVDLLIKIFDKKYASLTELNIKCMEVVSSYLGKKFNYEICSQKNYSLENVKEKDDWALEISKIEGATTYYNAIGGMKFFNREKYYNNGIDIKFIKTNNIAYKQSKRKFVPNLSIIDVMMFNSEKEIEKMLNMYELI